MPADDLVSVPDGLDSAVATGALLPFLTAHQMLYRVAAVEPGSRVLIHGGSGAVGAALLRSGRHLELEMVTTASDVTAVTAAAPGDTTVLEYTDDEYRRRLHEAAAVGPANFRRSYRLLAPEGVLVAYGFTGVLADVERRSLSSQYRLFSAFGATLAGMTLADARPDGRRVELYDVAGRTDERPDEFTADLSAVFESLADGVVTPPAAEAIPLAEARRAHELVERGVGSRVVLTS